MARAIQGIRNIQLNMEDLNRTIEQNCNFYKRELLILQNKETKDYNSYQIDEVVRRMEYYSYLIDLYTMESLEEWLYLPDKKIKLKSISDLMYYEKMYGQTIYEKKEY